MSNPNDGLLDEISRNLISSVTYQADRSVAVAKREVSKTVRTEVNGMFELIAQRMRDGIHSRPSNWNPKVWSKLNQRYLRKKERRGRFGYPAFFAYSGKLIVTLEKTDELAAFNQPTTSNFSDAREELGLDFIRKPYSVRGVERGFGMGRSPLASAQTTFKKGLNPKEYSFIVKVFPRLTDNPTEDEVAKIVAAAASDRRVLYKLRNGTIGSSRPKRDILLPALLYFIHGRVRDKVIATLRANGFQVT